MLLQPEQLAQAQLEAKMKAAGLKTFKGVTTGADQLRLRLGAGIEPGHEGGQGSSGLLVD
ncbi:hypothetical protein D3C75_609710 [compost metagenome]